jgi:membrane protease YdiL (CAAX protease family)
MDTALSDTPQPEPEIRVPWGLLAVALGLVMPALVWASGLAISLASDEELDLSDAEIIANVIAQVVFLDGLLLVGIPAVVALWRYHAGWASLGLRDVDSRYWWWPIAATFGALVAVYAYSLVAVLITGDAPEQETDELFKSPSLLPLVGFAVVIVAPIAEEIFFRGFVFAGMVRPFGPIPAMLVSGLIFGMFHVTNVETIGLVLPIGAIGALFAWLYYRTGSLWIAIATHMLFNLVGFALGAATAWWGLA